MITPVPDAPKSAAPAAEASLPALKELLEKNLKWSQIIYEQNRKINRKLLVMALADWLRVAVILIPLILAAIFLPPLVKSLIGQYGGLFGGKNTATTTGSSAWSDVLKLMPMTDMQREQLKAILK